MLCLEHRETRLYNMWKAYAGFHNPHIFFEYSVRK